MVGGEGGFCHLLEFVNSGGADLAYVVVRGTDSAESVGLASDDVPVLVSDEVSLEWLILEVIIVVKLLEDEDGVVLALGDLDGVEAGVVGVGRDVGADCLPSTGGRLRHNRHLSL